MVEANRVSGEGKISLLAQLLKDRERFFSEVADNVEIRAKLKFLLITMVALSAFYGTSVGFYQGGWQIVSAALKIPFVFIVTLLVTLPLFYIVQLLLGSKLGLWQVLALVLSALTLTSVILAAAAPISLFFLLTGGNYYFLHLLHIAIFGFAGLFGMFTLHTGLTVLCESKGVYPRLGIGILRIWVLIFAFVGIQLAWHLRPYVGKRGENFAVRKQYEGNFYSAVTFAVGKLFNNEPSPPPRLEEQPHTRGPIPQLFKDDTLAKPTR
ncbi:MAG TPA: hypothetical protein VI546_02760 [candidate division Zixibacteria bacterium]|nr:hypothetical protein [candidate division Zixibacteria bacterium]